MRVHASPLPGEGFKRPDNDPPSRVRSRDSGFSSPLQAFTKFTGQSVRAIKVASRACLLAMTYNLLCSGSVAVGGEVCRSGGRSQLPHRSKASINHGRYVGTPVWSGVPAGAAPHRWTSGGNPWRELKDPGDSGPAGAIDPILGTAA